MSEFKHVNVADLPAGWTAQYFGRLVSFRIGRTPSRNQKRFWENGKYPWVSISDMTPFGTLTETAELVSEKAHVEVFHGELVPAGALLMSFKLTIGRIARLGIPAYHNEAIISFRPNPDDLDPDYLAFHLAQINYLDYQDTAVKGQTLNKSKLSNLEIIIPPVAEQRKIAAVLKLVRQAVEQQERLLALTDELKKALRRQLFTHGLHGEPHKQTEIGSIPQSWDLVPLLSLLREPLRNGHSAKETIDGTGVRTLTLTAVTQRDFCDENTKLTSAERNRVKDMWLEAGDILVERANTRDYVGLAAIYEGPRNWAIFPDLMIRVRVDPSRVIPEYLAEHLLTERSRIYFQQNARSTAGNFPKIDQSTVETILVPLPSVAEQHEIATALRTIQAQSVIHQRKHDALNSLFRTLLHKLMTAQMRVHDLDFFQLEHAAAA